MSSLFLSSATTEVLVRKSGFTQRLAMYMEYRSPSWPKKRAQYLSKPHRTLSRPTPPGDRLNKAVVEKAGCLYSRHLAKRALPGRGLRASQAKNTGSEGLGGGAIAGEAKGVSVLPGRGPARPLGRRALRSLRNGRHGFVYTRPGLRLGDVTDSVGARPKH